MTFELAHIFRHKAVDQSPAQNPIGIESTQSIPTPLESTKTPDEARQEANTLAAKLNKMTPVV